MRESTTAVVARNETWSGPSASEPYEAGWASEVVVFICALDAGGAGIARVQISADGMRWADEGTSFPLPTDRDEITFARIRHFGNWIRVAVDPSTDNPAKLLVTIHAKA
jgi:hypothetical protein